MKTQLNLTATFGPKSATGQKFTEIYTDLEQNLHVSDNEKYYSSLGYQADEDKYGNIKIYGPEDQPLNAIDGKHPDFTELKDKGPYIIQTLLDTACRHLILTSDEGREAIAEDMKRMPRDNVQARLSS